MQTLTLPFEISGDSYGIGEPQLIEFRLFTHGKRSGRSCLPSPRGGSMIRTTTRRYCMRPTSEPLSKVLLSNVWGRRDINHPFWE